MIDPTTLFKMIDKLKKKGNKYYQFYDNYNQYQARCRESDPVGYDVIFQDDVLEDIEKMVTDEVDLQDEIMGENEIPDGDDDEKEDNEYETKDPVKKYQFEYNKSLCMTNKYPEISVNETDSVSVAPGEGKIPKDILGEDDWDIKAFPYLNNPDGSNGKDQERNVRLTDQNYFIQRLCNKERRFAQSPAYMYAALGYLEKKQLQRNINLANTRGKEVVNEKGEKAYMLDDGYRVLDDIKNTPRYWKKAKHEMIAKLDNLGPFHLFFTLSCADMRWDENFASIVQEKGFDIKYEVIKDDEDNWDTIVEARRNGDPYYKPIKKFIEEDVEESLHELIRGNVLSATRYYHQCVKQFIQKVVLGANNPMHIKNYTYKVEFQDRGAGHIHGTLWLRMEKIEKLIKNTDGTLREGTPEDSNDGAKFKGLASAFRKFRNNEPLDDKGIEASAVANFIDEFTTVSTHEKTVGREVAKIASEVNKHHHTKSCRKHDTTCRFHYPRYPSPHTIIVIPCEGESQEDINAKMAKHRRVLNKVKDVLEKEDVITRIMNKYEKQKESKEEYKENTKLRIDELLKIASVEYKDYMEALATSRSGYSIVQRRDLDEININSYNVEWIRAWNGNMDIQIVLDYFAVITYVTNYYSKDDTGTMEVIKAALEQSEAKDVKDKMRTVSNAFLTHRQMGEAESVYKLIPSMTLKKSNVACQWISLGRKEERTSRWKRATEKMKESGRPLIELIGHEGLWFEQQDMWSKYLRRPMNTLEHMCFAQFGKMYSSYSQTKSQEGVDRKDEENEVEEDDGYITEDTEDKFNYVMNYKNNSKQGTKLPEYIILNDPYPGEPHMMRKRNFPAVLRFNKTNPGITLRNTCCQN